MVSLGTLQRPGLRRFFEHTVNLLLIEDSERLRRSLAIGLRRAGYAVDVAGDGEAGLWQAHERAYDAVVLDLMLPKLDGLEVLRRLRESGSQAYVIILTARDAVDDRVRGLRAGADDYLPKPFDFAELLARVGTLCRRAYGRDTSILTVGDLVIDRGARLASRAGAPLLLTRREFALLELLALRLGQIVSRTEIEAHLYEEDADLMSNTVDSTVCLLRQKIQPPGMTTLLHTRRGLGYLLDRP